jgi:hypothetical protein
MEEKLSSKLKFSCGLCNSQLRVVRLNLNVTVKLRDVIYERSLTAFVLSRVRLIVEDVRA